MFIHGVQIYILFIHGDPILDHEVMWQGIVKACKILKYPESSAMHRDYFETMFDMSCFIWFQMYSESKRTECINNLIIL